MSFSSTFISTLFSLSSSALTSTQDMTRESRINHTNRMVLTACLQTHPLDLPTFHNLGIGSPDLRSPTTGVQLRLHVKIYDECDAELLSDDFIRLRLRSPSHFHWAPGQTASPHLTIPSISRLPFEAHPFTIANIDSRQFHVLKEQEPRAYNSD
ncbi:hypothetical protein M405DRAFT_480756 [Rhizopogon salebrosus TDB-379]|nr:hypothetical protein M405DRAFT_480756 [Rhizopogon salebrosus TDB-379]